MIILIVVLGSILALGVAALAGEALLQAAAGWEFDRSLGRTSDILHQGVLRQADWVLAEAPHDV